MSQATLPSRLSETLSGPEPIVSRLRTLRRAVGLWLWARGLARALLLLLAVVSIDLLLDRFLKMDRIQRGGCLILAVMLLAFYTYRFLIAPLRHSIDDDNLVLRVEHRHEELGQSLISALQFSRMTGFEELGVSTAMVRATIDHGTNAAEGLNFGDVLNDSVLRRNLLLVAAVVAVFVGAFALPATQPTMLVWLNRNILLGDELWPQKSHLVVQGAIDGRVVRARGDDWTAVVTVKKGWEEMPSEVVFESRPLDLPFWRGSRTAPMDKLGDQDGHFELPFSNVLEPFKFRIKSDHETTRWYYLDLVDRPSVEKLTLMLTPPPYTNEASRELPVGKGPHVAYEGSRLAISGTANKPLSSAVLSNGDWSINLDCTENEFSGSIPKNELIGGAYSITLTDDERSKLESSNPTKFTIKLKADRAPAVRATLKGISGIIVAGARVPVEYKIRDEFGIASARLDYQLHAADSASAPAADDAEAAPAPKTVSIPFDALGDQYGKRKIEYTYLFDLKEKLKEPAIGTRLVFWVRATDANDVSGPKTGESDKLYLRIVTRAELINDLARRETEQGQTFMRLLKDQEDMLNETEVILAIVAGKSTMPDKQRRDLIRIHRRQNLVSDRCDQIASQLEKLVAEMRNNRLNVPGLVKKLTELVIDPLRKLAKDSDREDKGLVPQATRFLDDARRAASNPASRDAALVRARDTQRQIVREMKKISKNMRTAEGYSDIVNRFYEILKAQNDLNTATQEEKDRELDRIFEGGFDKPEPKKTDTP